MTLARALLVPLGNSAVTGFRVWVEVGSSDSTVHEILMARNLVCYNVSQGELDGDNHDTRSKADRG
jgi:hypothetical protein